GLVGPHTADVHDRSALAPGDHAAGHGLGDEEHGPVQFGVGVVVGAVVVEERLGDEQPGRVDQQGGVGVLGGQLLADPLHLHPVGQVGGDAQAEPSLARVWTVSSTLPACSPMMTALPPAATTSAAVWRPIPLLPPTTTSF